MDEVLKDEGWKVVGKTIRQLIFELETFGDKDLVVEISADGGEWEVNWVEGKWYADTATYSKGFARIGAL
ncbi:hypothetical protein [Pseudomonas sp. BN515]|uniref:hypothetical protein n=1 Tax=Pseudomonas sp. BN515 TaxID=2567892 RepID=UPI002458FDD9|nr:hypothetical protein [Pseudomonas sp. BN515]MDH4872536.1 hypothetical protein [Pseudomonas sp. BN515]